MKPRPMRPNLYHEIKRCGVYQGDWRWILPPTAAAYIVPFVAGWWIYHIPLGVPLGAVTFLLLLSVFTFLRASKPRCWLLHRLDAATDGWSKLRRPIGGDNINENWTLPD